MPFGAHPCCEHYPEHLKVRAAELIEWLDYFKPRMPDFPYDKLPQTEKLGRRLEEKNRE